MNERRAAPQTIDRPDDPRIAGYARVGDPAWLEANGLFVAEGRLVVQRLLSMPRFTVRSLLLTPAAFHALAPASNVQAYLADQSTLHAITGFNFHRGCLALAERPGQPVVPAGMNQASRLLAIEAVGNPDNVGGLFRVAAAFGAGGVLLDPATGDPFYRKAIRTSMGAVLSVPFARMEPWPAGLQRFRESGFRILALTPRGSARDLRTVASERADQNLLLVGAEGAGLSDAALSMADVLVRIPMAPGVDSLNVTVAAGIAFSHLV